MGNLCSAPVTRESPLTNASPMGAGLTGIKEYRQGPHGVHRVDVYAEAGLQGGMPGHGWHAPGRPAMQVSSGASFHQVAPLHQSGTPTTTTTTSDSKSGANNNNNRPSTSDGFSEQQQQHHALAPGTSGQAPAGQGDCAVNFEDGPLDASNSAPFTWVKGRLVGQGAFGRVYKGLVCETGQEIAIKQVSLPRDDAQQRRVSEHVRALESEVGVLKGLQHENIVQYIGTEQTDEHLNIFLEYVPGGSISSKLASFGALPESTIKIYTKQILRGLQYLHAKRFMHRDIKGANILTDSNGVVKLADFGASRRIEDLATIGSGAKSIKGTPYWMAPEVIKQTGHGRPADIWSLGCVVIEMATGKPPWTHCQSQVAVMFHIASTRDPPPLPDSLSPQAKDFLLLCFNRVPKERPNAARLLKHPWLVDVVVPVQSTPRLMIPCRQPMQQPQAAPGMHAFPGQMQSIAVAMTAPGMQQTTHHHAMKAPPLPALLTASGGSGPIIQRAPPSPIKEESESHYGGSPGAVSSGFVGHGAHATPPRGPSRLSMNASVNSMPTGASAVAPEQVQLQGFNGSVHGHAHEAPGQMGTPQRPSIPLLPIAAMKAGLLPPTPPGAGAGIPPRPMAPPQHAASHQQQQALPVRLPAGHLHQAAAGSTSSGATTLADLSLASILPQQQQGPVANTKKAAHVPVKQFDTLVMPPPMEFLMGTNAQALSTMPTTAPAPPPSIQGSLMHAQQQQQQQASQGAAAAAALMVQVPVQYLPSSNDVYDREVAAAEAMDPALNPRASTMTLSGFNPIEEPSWVGLAPGQGPAFLQHLAAISEAEGEDSPHVPQQDQFRASMDKDKGQAASTAGGFNDTGAQSDQPASIHRLTTAEPSNNLVSKASTAAASAPSDPSVYAPSSCEQNAMSLISALTADDSSASPRPAHGHGHGMGMPLNAQASAAARMEMEEAGIRLEGDVELDKAKQWRDELFAEILEGRAKLRAQRESVMSHTQGHGPALMMASGSPMAGHVHPSALAPAAPLPSAGTSNSSSGMVMAPAPVVAGTGSTDAQMHHFAGVLAAAAAQGGYAHAPMHVQARPSVADL